MESSYKQDSSFLSYEEHPDRDSAQPNMRI